MDVYVDGNLRRTFDGYSATTRMRVPVDITGLSAGAHRLDVVVRGQKGHAAATDTNVALDAISWPTGWVWTPQFEYAWGEHDSAAHSAGYASQSDLPGSSASVTFRGNAIELAPVLAPGSRN